MGCLSHIVQYSLVTRIYESLFYFEFSIVLWQSYIFTSYPGLDMMLLYSPQIPTRAMIGKQTPSAHQSTARPSSSMEMLRLGLEMSMAWFNSLLHRPLVQIVNEYQILDCVKYPNIICKKLIKLIQILKVEVEG